MFLSKRSSFVAFLLTDSMPFSQAVFGGIAFAAENFFAIACLQSEVILTITPRKDFEFRRSGWGCPESLTTQISAIVEAVIGLWTRKPVLKSLTTQIFSNSWSSKAFRTGYAFIILLLLQLLLNILSSEAFRTASTTTAKFEIFSGK